jgi:hypothetical protein
VKRVRNTILIAILLFAGFARPAAAYWLEVAGAATECGYIALESVVFAESAPGLFATQLSILILIDAGVLEAIVAPTPTTDPNYLDPVVPEALSDALTPPASPPPYYHLLAEAWAAEEAAVSSARAYRLAQRRFRSATIADEDSAVIANARAMHQSEGATFLGQLRSGLLQAADRMEAFADSLEDDPSAAAGYGRLKLHVAAGVQAVKDSFQINAGFPVRERPFAAMLHATTAEETRIRQRVATTSTTTAVAILGDSLELHRVYWTIAQGLRAAAATSDAAWGYPFVTTVDAPATAPAFRLGPTIPNPANRQASLAFTLARAGDVTVEVFDGRGVRVDTPFRGTLPAGEHRSRLNVDRYSAGTYFCRLTVNGRSSSRKLLVVH